MMMNLKIFMILVLMAGCTVKNDNTSTPDARKKSCSDLSLDQCVKAEECSPIYGDDAATAESFFMDCMPLTADSDCNINRLCYTNSTGQRAIALNCDYPHWNEVACTQEELNPCQYTTVADCEADKRCLVNRAKDLASKETIAMGCGYIKDSCNQIITCYSNKLTGARVMAGSSCKTAFPEWEHSGCTPEDYAASQSTP